MATDRRTLPVESPYPLGCHVPDQLPKRFRGVPAFSTANPRIDPDRWTDGLSHRSLVTNRYMQQHSDCVGNGTAKGLGAAFNQQYDAEYVFSAAWIYAHVNGGRDEGAMVRDAAEFAMGRDVCLALQSEVGEHKVFKRDYKKSEAELVKKAGRFAVECFQCEDWIDMGSAKEQGFFVVYGILLGNAFFDISSNGVVPPFDGSVANGHCMSDYGHEKIDGKWHSDTGNSWEGWGDEEGFGKVPMESYFTPSVRDRRYGEVANLDAFAFRLVYDPSRTGPVVTR